MLNVRGPLRVLILMIVVGVCAACFVKQMVDIFYVLPQGGSARANILANPMKLLMQKNPLWAFDPSMIAVLLGCIIMGLLSFGAGRRAYWIATIPITLFLVFMGWSTYYYMATSYFSEEQSVTANIASESIGGVVSMLQVRTGLFGVEVICLVIAAIAIQRPTYRASLVGTISPHRP